MGRGRVQLKRIENKTSQQVTFFKRRTGLLKKANEISVLCDAQVALIMFSTKGKLFEYSSAPSMEDILERYERQNHTELTGATNETQGNWSFEYMKLTAKVQVLERNLRNFVGNDLDPLSVKELQSLEQQLDTSLKRIRTRKNQVMNQSISELHKRARALQEQNSKLAKTKEKEKTVNEHHPKRGLETIGLGQCSSTLNLICQPEVTPPPQRLVPSLNLRDALQARGTLEMEETGEPQTVPRSNNSLIPAWMLQHLTN
ncbi:transcription factor CAULIFLOWER A [Trifolium repens]|nr:transcription factor CAULIFLOWER A [Trifolium repens]